MWLAAVALISVVSIIAVEATLLLGQVLLPDVLNPRRILDRAITNIDQAKFDDFRAAVIRR
jgi:hypothetical protein